MCVGVCVCVCVCGCVCVCVCVCVCACVVSGLSCLSPATHNRMAGLRVLPDAGISSNRMCLHHGLHDVTQGLHAVHPWALSKQCLQPHTTVSW